MLARTPLNSPLVQFFIAGLLIFGLYSISNKDSEASPQAITITSAEQKNLVALFSKTWRRPPTQAEFNGLIEARVREELFYREALALGLENDDVIVRRRLAQKIEFITDDLAAIREPTEQDLEKFLRDNENKYALEPSLNFRQVYLSSERRGPSLMDDAAAILAELKRGADPSALGDVIELPRTMENVSPSTVSRLFGKEFASALAQTKPGEWSGPVRSSYGAHLVQVDSREDGRVPKLDEARTAVERDWGEAQRQKARAAYIDALKKKYEIHVEQPKDGGA